MIVADNFTNTTNAPSSPRARVELYNGSTLLNTYSDDDYLQGFNVERIGEDSKFFGFGVCHKITVILGDYEDDVDLAGANWLEVSYGIGDDFLYTYPYFIIDEITRDEATKEYTITAYDELATAAGHTAAELGLPEGERTIRDYAVACAALLGLQFRIEGVQDNSFALSCTHTANLGGTESVREVLNDIAEATQTIYFINNESALIFKRLDKNGAAVATINNNNSMGVIVGETQTLTGITHTTELGNNVNANTGEDGVTQYVHDNAFWDLREDIAELLDAALANGGMSITPFSADWFGNYLLEVGDKIAVETEDGNVIYSYVLNDVIAYTGVVLEQSQWIYAKGEDESANSNRLGDALKQTSARVDKVNKKIELIVSDRDDEKEQLTLIQQTADEVNIAVQEIVTNGVDKVVTGAGYKFDAEGLTVSKEGSEMSTQITDDGMTVSRGNTELLTANHEGVNATNLHATTYLIIGGNSRFEDYESTRTACFWIGG